MLVTIKHRRTAAVLFEGEFETLLSALQEAIRKGANLMGANLVGSRRRWCSRSGLRREP